MNVKLGGTMITPYSTQVLNVIRYGIQMYGSAAELSRVSGVSRANISRWLQGVPPRTSDVEPIMNLLKMRLAMPTDIEGEPIAYEFVPKIEALAGAGSSLVTSDETEALYAFRRDFFQRERINPKNCVMLDVFGDSMVPVLNNGDMILIDKSDTDIVTGRIYLVTLCGELLIKRVLRSAKGFLLHSENPSYPDVPVESADLDTFMVHGRLRWSCHAF